MTKQSANKPSSLEHRITQAWQRQAKWLYLFMPISLLYAGISKLRRHLYCKGILSSYQAPIPVMIIGNITVGGSGKTPLIISLVKYLRQKDIKVAVISRGYGGDYQQMPALVSAHSLPSVVGDEPCLIAQATLTTDDKSIPISVCPNRQQAIELILQKHPDTQLIISDDGLQHYKLQRDIEWVVVDSSRGFGNQQLLPTGFLREPLSRLNNTSVIYNQSLSSDDNHDYSQAKDKRQTNKSLAKQASHAQTQAQQSQMLAMTFVADELIPLTQLLSTKLGDDDFDTVSNKATSINSVNNTHKPSKGASIVAVSGIGYPQRFFSTLQQLGYQVTPMPYPDHHKFSFDDFIDIAQNADERFVIITSKDAVKFVEILNQYFNKGCNQQPIDNAVSTLHSLDSLDSHHNIASLAQQILVLPITAQLNDASITELDNIIKQLPAYKN